jgi:hypothetical protein
LYFCRSVFCFRTFPYNDAFLTYSAKSTKNLNIQVIWDLGPGNPATLGRKLIVSKETVEGPATTAMGVGEKGRLTARSHVTWSTRFTVTWGSEMTLKKGPWLLGLTLSTPKHCHMDLWLVRLVLTHHLKRLHQLPSATAPGDKVSSFFFNSSVFYGGLPFALILVSLELLSSSLLE